MWRVGERRCGVRGVVPGEEISGFAFTLAASDGARADLEHEAAFVVAESDVERLSAHEARRLEEAVEGVVVQLADDRIFVVVARDCGVDLLVSRLAAGGLLECVFRESPVRREGSSGAEGLTTRDELAPGPLRETTLAVRHPEQLDGLGVALAEQLHEGDELVSRALELAALVRGEGRAGAVALEVRLPRRLLLRRRPSKEERRAESARGGLAPHDDVVLVRAIGRQAVHVRARARDEARFFHRDWRVEPSQSPLRERAREREPIDVAADGRVGVVGVVVVAVVENGRVEPRCEEAAARVVVELVFAAAATPRVAQRRQQPLAPAPLVALRRVVDTALEIGATRPDLSAEQLRNGVSLGAVLLEPERRAVCAT